LTRHLKGLDAEVFYDFPFVLVVMSGLFGTRASVFSDLNLILHIVLLVLLLAGFVFGRKKSGNSLRTHGRFMTVLVVLNALSILLIMGPSLFTNLGAAVDEVFTVGFPLTLLHHSIGLIAEVLGAALVFKKFGNVRRWMRITFLLWLVALLSGIGFYVMYYLV
jgi:uncharacterized membrane protein YozB (DUF420 family)